MPVICIRNGKSAAYRPPPRPRRDGRRDTFARGNRPLIMHGGVASTAWDAVLHMDKARAYVLRLEMRAPCTVDRSLALARIVVVDVCTRDRWAALRQCFIDPFTLVLHDRGVEVFVQFVLGAGGMLAKWCSLLLASGATPAVFAEDTIFGTLL